MNSLVHLRCIFCAVILCAFASLVSAATPGVPDRRDGQVLEALLLHLLADPHFDRTRISTNGTSIVLHARTPRITPQFGGLLLSQGADIDIGDQRLLSDAETSLRERNSRAEAKPNNILSVTASVTAYYTDLTFGAGIVVADLTPTWDGRRSTRAFREAYPKARGWVEAYLPGYSKDGTHAIVCARAGPSAHGVKYVTALLERSGDKWVVKWHYISLCGLYA